MHFLLAFHGEPVIIEGMDSKERMKTWEELSEPRPTWETWKRILAQKKFDPVKAKEQWDKISKKQAEDKKKRVDNIIFKV